MIRRILLLLLALMLLSAPALAAEGDGVIEGTLVNATSGEKVANQELTLKTYLNNAELLADTTATDAEGSFVFSGLATTSDYLYGITLTYQEAEYNTAAIVFNAGETTKSVEVTVYDSTSSDEAIEVEQSHTIIYVDKDGLLIKEYYLFTNYSDLTYIGIKPNADSETRQTLKFYLPDGASEFQIGGDLMSCCILSSEDGFVDSMPVFPGAREINYSYKVGYESGEYMMSRRVDYNVINYNLLVQGGGVLVASDQLTQEESLDMAGNIYSFFSGGSLGAGEVVEAAISGLPEVSNQNAATWVTVAVAIMTLGAVSGYLWWKRRSLRPIRQEAILHPQGGLPQPKTFDRKRQRLLRELAQLDDDFEAGRIAEDNYRHQRQAVKARLIELVSPSKESSGSG